MADTLCLAIDTMGGDFGPRVTVPAIFDVLRQTPQLTAVLLGDRAQITAELPSDYDTYRDRMPIQHCEQSVMMDEKPSHALRHKRNSSMWHAIALVSEGKAGAAVSAGNTGALLAMSLIQLRTQPGIKRPAIGTKIPTTKGFTYLLDMGANIDCTADQLYQFALMADQRARYVDQIPSPKVALLNIGSEELKGSLTIQDAAQRLERNPAINYIGYIEGDALFAGQADIVVCDGFNGNIALKTAEGAAKFFADSLKSSLGGSFSGRIAALLARGPLRALGNKFSPATYNGASLLGLQGIVVKSHGSADRLGFAYAIKAAIDEASFKLPQLIEATLVESEN